MIPYPSADSLCSLMIDTHNAPIISNTPANTSMLTLRTFPLYYISI